MFGFIKNLITGILNFFVGLFGGSKGGYYLELDEAAEGKQPTTAKEVKSTEKPVAQPVAATTEKETNGAKQAASTAQPVSTMPVQTANGLKAEPAPKEKKIPVSNTTQQPAGETTFAPKYLAPSTGLSNGGRRRPGANMSSFLDMARQVKTSN